MTADDAFDKLLARNALNIPIANPSAGRAEPTAAQVRGAKPRKTDEALKVLEMLDGDPDGKPDYHPERHDSDTVVFSTPTETDLPVVENTPDRLGGSQIFGKDIDLDDLFSAIGPASGADTVVEAKGPPRPTPPPVPQTQSLTTTLVTPPVPAAATATTLAAAEAGLRLARKVRRFAYLPLAGMEAFESRARDTVASLISQNPDRPSLAITNPRRGDGQTEVAIRLALAAAKRVDYRVLLADFDMKKPQIARRLGLSSKYFTLADILRGSCRLGEALMYSEEDNLYVLPARASDREGDEVLNDRQVAALLGQLHAVFNFSILACGAIESGAPMIACRHAGATALAGYCGVSRVGGMREAAETLMDAGVKVAGLLLTGA